MRQPDWFQVGVEKVLDYYEANRGKVILGLASLIVLLLLLGGWQLFKQRQNSLAAHEFGKALALYHGAKYREAVAALENVKGYRWSEYAPLADLYQANSYLLTNDLERALPSAQRFVSATRPNTLYRQIGLVAVAVTQERMKQCKAAIENYREAEKISAPFRDKAISGRARCHEQTGEFKAAIAAYREHLREQPSGIVPLKIAELEAKVVEGGKK